MSVYRLLLRVFPRILLIRVFLDQGFQKLIFFLSMSVCVFIIMNFNLSNVLGMRFKVDLCHVELLKLSYRE